MGCSETCSQKGGEKFLDFAQEVENEKMLLRGLSFEQLQKETRRGSSAHQLAARAILREEYGNEEK